MYSYKKNKTMQQTVKHSKHVTLHVSHSWGVTQKALS